VFQSTGGKRANDFARLREGDCFCETSLVIDHPIATTLRAEGEVL
jgi:hypothetical protein